MTESHLATAEPPTVLDIVGWVGTFEVIGPDAYAATSSVEHWIIRLVQATQDAVVTIDASSRIVLFNAAAEKMFGYSAEEVQGEHITLLMPSPYREEHDDYVARYERTGEPRAIGRIRTVTAQRRNGETFPIELSVTQIAVGDEMRYGAFIRDISEKTRMQQELLERERLAAVGTTAAKFAHEVSNPLNGMFTQAQLIQRRLQRERSPDERIVKSVDLILRGLQQLGELLDDFRSMFRRVEYHFGPTCLAQLCREVRELEAAAFTSGISLDVDLPDDLPPVRADAPKLKRALVNLCKNAAEAMNGEGRIEVRADVGPKTVVLRISDTGCGVAAGLDIFAPFASTKPAGTGLGLPIVKQIVADHAGEIRYESREGEGTTFLLTLPRADATS